ncbi:MAG: hypothetical protein OH316_01395 [Candidatus Parvarchaeota archaeon]|nr:hypothetical protein [Candidatus Parvarchaeota archaeon]
MGDFRLDPDNLNYTIILPKDKSTCKVCSIKEEPAQVLKFDSKQVKIYPIKTEVEPSKFELQGDRFKSSPSHGYEELIVDREKHGDNFSNLSPEDTAKLLSVISDRIIALSDYKIGDNIIITRCLSGHGAFDLHILPIPKFERRGCSVCKDNLNTKDREIYKDENFVIYAKFAPISDLDIVISPIKHLSFEALDEVLLFDLAGLIQRLIKTLNSGDISLVIYESAGRHATVEVLSGCVSAYRFLQINEVNVAPEEAAKKLREKFKI